MRLVPKSSVPVIGPILSMISSRSGQKFHEYIDRRHQKLGPIFKENLGFGQGYFLADPHAMRKVFSYEGKYPKHIIPAPWTLYNKLYGCKRGLFFMDDEEWYKYRTIMNVHLLKNNEIMENLRPVHEAVVDNFVQRFKKYDGKVIPDLENEFFWNSMSFITGTLMGSAYVKNMADFSDDITHLAKIVNSIFSTTANLSNKPLSVVSKLQLAPWTDFVSAVNCSLQASRHFVEKMIGTCSPDGILQDILKENIPKEVLTAIIMDLMLAAGDTTSFSSQWALYLLSKDPEAQQRLRENSNLVKGVFKETLRLYPPSVFITRVLEKESNLLGYDIPPGALILLSMYSVGQDPNAFQNPELFWPERWSRRPDTGRYIGVFNPAAHLPFALGARSCIGRRLAETQAHLTIEKIVSSYELVLQEEVEMVLRLIPVPEKPIQIVINTINESRQ